MGAKRPHSDVHPSRRDQVPQPSRKRQKPDNLGAKSFKKAHPVNELKSRVRDLTRLLSRADDKLPAHIRVAKERELQTTQHELEDSIVAERKSKLISRYHKIRFFDRQKATKRLKRAKKALQELDGQSDAAQATLYRKEIVEYEVDVNYAMYYPLDKPYNSLYPREAEDPTKDEHGQSESSSTRKGDPAMRALVKECMASGQLDDLRNGKIDKASDDKETPVKDLVRAKTKARPSTKPGTIGVSKRTQQQDEEEDSDGGFFE